MTRHLFHLFLQPLILIIASLGLVQCASLEPIDSEVGKDLAVPLGNASGCSVSASHALGQNNGKVRLAASSLSRTVHADLFTGKSLTNTEVLRRVSDAFGRAAAATPGSNLYTLGDLKYGGEARFIAQQGGAVEIQYLGNSTGNSFFDGEEVRILKGLIDQAL